MDNDIAPDSPSQNQSPPWPAQPGPEPPPLLPPEPPPSPHSKRAGKRLSVVGLLFAAGAATGSGVAAGVLTARATQSITTTTIRPATSLPNGGTVTAPGGATGGGSVSSGSGSSSSVAAAVAPAVADINGTLATGGQVAGTGIVLTSSGVILTNNHVIEGTSSLSVQIDGAGPVYSATVLGTDATHDIALVKISASGLTPASIGNSSSVSVGQTVVAVGNALGQGGTPAATQGSITAVNQTITAGGTNATTETLSGTIQINAPIQPGDSGGPLVDTSGKVIGIDTAAQSSGRLQTAVSTVAFAIPINTAMSIAQQIESGQSSSTVQIGTRGILGVAVAGNASASGAVVSAVESGSPAAAAGLAAGDVITGINGAPVTSASALQSALIGRHPGDSVSVGWTDTAGAQHSMTLQLEAGPPA